MRLEISIENIEKIAKQKKAENASFKSYLQGQEMVKVDQVVHRLYEDIAPQISCLECGNCCHNLRPEASDTELIKYVEPENIEDFRYLKGFACKNLDGKKCTIYLDRYEECREYPYLHRNGFITRLVGVLQNYEICPIIFNVFEHLKIELEWKDKQ